MRRIRIALGFASVAVLVLAAGYAGAAGDEKDGGVTTGLSTVPGGFNGNMDYTGGPNVCGECHLQAFEDWLTHGHSRKLALAFELGSSVDNTDVGDRGHTSHARSQGFPLPTHDRDLFNWENVLMVVGGSKHWKSRFVDTDGYFITKNGLNQYNWETGEWVDYNKDVVMKPFDCGSCHTTGYDADGTTFQDEYDPPIPGIVGDFVHINITCEACHGPGAAHAAAPSSDNIVSGDDITTETCGACHTRGDDPDVILASGGFIRHHEQWPEYRNSPHAFFDFAFDGCSTCHNGHVGRYEGTTNDLDGDALPTCEDCHAAQAAEYEGSAMFDEGVMCIDCHMGFAGRSARARGPWEGDVWTHLFKIDSDADYDMFNRDAEGNTVSAKDAISLEFACFRCHAEASKAAFAAIGDDSAAYHTLGK